MKIDSVSTNIIKIALYIDKSHPGFVSELWLDNHLKEEVTSNIPNHLELDSLISKTQELLQQVKENRRRKYLREILDSLIFQLKALQDPDISFSVFSKHAFGFEMKRITDTEIEAIHQKIKDLEVQLGHTRQEVYKKQILESDKILPRFESYIKNVKELLPRFITDFPDKGFLLELVANKPWSAFNSHEAPFSSKLSINTDVDLTDIDLHHLAFHEAYGGHHSELSQKDKLLIKGSGEHGLVITFSPQTFISEAIAEGIYFVFQDKKDDLEQQMVWNYNRLTFALQNLATYLFLDDKMNRDQIDQELKRYAVSDKTRENILNFSTDKLFSRYAPVYYTAYNFFEKIYNETFDKEKLLKTLFTQPCTPNLVLEEFSSSK